MKINSLTSSLVFSIILSSSAFSVIPSNKPVSDFFESHTNEMNLYKLGASDSSDVLIEVVLTKYDISSVNSRGNFNPDKSALEPPKHNVASPEHEHGIRPEVYVDWSDGLHYSTSEYEYLASMGVRW